MNFLSAERIRTGAVFSLLTFWVTLSFSPALSEAALWTAFTLWIAGLAWAKQKPFWPDKTALIFLLLFFAAALFSLGVTEHMKQSSRGIMKILRHILIFLMTFDLFAGKTSQKRWCFVLLAGCSLVLADGVFQFFTGNDFLRHFPYEPSGAGPRLTAGLGNYGKLAAYMLVVLPPVLFYTVQAFRQKQLNWRTFSLFFLSLGGLWLLFATKSRGAFVAFFTGMLFLLLLRKNWKLIITIIAAAAVFLSLLPREKIIHLDANNQEQSIVERFELWHRAWDVIQARPFTGTGINTYAVAHQQFDTRKNWRVQNYYAHNGYLQTAAEIGIPGLVFFLLFLMRWLWINKPSGTGPESEIRWGLLGGLLSFLIFCMADTAMHSPQPVMTFWYAAALSELSQSQTSRNKNACTFLCLS